MAIRGPSDDMSLSGKRGVMKQEESSVLLDEMRRGVCLDSDILHLEEKDSKVDETGQK